MSDTLTTRLIKSDLHRLKATGAKAQTDHWRKIMCNAPSAKDCSQLEIDWCMYRGEHKNIMDAEYCILYERHSNSLDPAQVGRTSSTEEFPHGRTLYSGGCVDFIIENMHFVKFEYRAHPQFGVNLYWFAHDPKFKPSEYPTVQPL